VLTQTRTGGKNCRCLGEKDRFVLPLVGLALNFLPDLVNLIAGDKAGSVAQKVSQAVVDVTGTADSAAAEAKLSGDAAAVSALRQKLAEIAVQELQLRNQEADKQREDLLATLKEMNANTEGARSMLGQLSSAKSPLAYTPLIVSIVVTAGFFFILAQLIYFGIPAPKGQSTSDDTVNILNIAIGVLGTAFATVVNFWLGSSSGSKDKDAQVLDLQAQNNTQTRQMFQTLQTVQQNHAQQTNVAIQALKDVAISGNPPAAVTDAAPAAPETDNFDRCVSVTLAQEGGFSADPNDPGGATNLGITRATLEAWRGKPVTPEDVRNLTKAEAVEIYRSNYWNPARCADLPDGVDLMVFDFAVNSGPRTAVKALQRSVGVTEDGSVGPNTLRAAKAAPAPDVIHAIGQRRLEFLRGLNTWADYGDGWTKRVNQVVSSALIMCNQAKVS
jgi:hypothetical protein